jgi:protein-tyrosine-phosphatase
MTTPAPRTAPFNVLFLCTHNSARSQIAEAVMLRKAEKHPAGRYQIASAGSAPGPRVHPMAIRALQQSGIDWSGHHPKSIDEVSDRQWDLIITVCDRAKESCPVMPGQPAYAHWGIDDPSDAGDEPAMERAFSEAVNYLSRRVDLLLALPVESLGRLAIEKRVQDIADQVPVPRSAGTH